MQWAKLLKLSTSIRPCLASVETISNRHKRQHRYGPVERRQAHTLPPSAKYHSLWSGEYLEIAGSKPAGDMTGGTSGFQMPFSCPRVVPHDVSHCQSWAY